LRVGETLSHRFVGDRVPFRPGVAANGLVISQAVGFKISKFGDDPPGSGTLNCSNP